MCKNRGGGGRSKNKGRGSHCGNLWPHAGYLLPASSASLVIEVPLRHHYGIASPYKHIRAIYHDLRPFRYHVLFLLSEIVVFDAVRRCFSNGPLGCAYLSVNFFFALPVGCKLMPLTQHLRKVLERAAHRLRGRVAHLLGLVGHVFIVEHGFIFLMHVWLFASKELPEQYSNPLNMLKLLYGTVVGGVFTISRAAAWLYG
jgi:hypothetical protein